ncbi:MAG: hypothetical protein H6R16_1704 [Proteobacteria bacterium]|nr:hypothetical protein [Pseudomonadota bacterium]
MTRAIEPATPGLNRLRAAIALIPIIESGLADSKISQQRAAEMTRFCEWAANCFSEGEEESKLLAVLTTKLLHLKKVIAAGA